MNRINRRDFLRLAGVAMGGLAISSVPGLRSSNLLGATEEPEFNTTTVLMGGDLKPVWGASPVPGADSPAGASGRGVRQGRPAGRPNNDAPPEPSIRPTLALPPFFRCLAADGDQPGVGHHRKGDMPIPAVPCKCL